MKKKPVCVFMCCKVTKKTKTQSLFDEFSYSFNTYSFNPQHLQFI